MSDEQFKVLMELLQEVLEELRRIRRATTGTYDD